jgi:hypothetical protein
MERLRCNACQQVFTADEPETAGPEKYAVTVVAMIALLKCVGGTDPSGIVSLVGAWTIALFFTGWKHAGENIADVLKCRHALETLGGVYHYDALAERLRFHREHSGP